MSPGRPRPSVATMPRYRPGKSATQAEVDHGITGAVKLASNENPLPTPDPIVAAISQAAVNLNRYADHRATSLRQRLAAHLGVAADTVTVGNGSVGLLQQVALGYLDPGDEVVFPWRSFEVYPVYTQLMNAEAVTVPLAADLGFDLERVVAAVSPATKLVLLATPNNPTGVAVPTSDLGRLLEAISTDTIVVIDEAYREFLDPGFGDPVAELIDAHPHALVTRTMSKAHGLAGARIGYAVGDPEVVATIDATLAPFAVSALAQAAGLAALDHLDIVESNVGDILAERARVEVELAARGWELPRHQANFVWLSSGEHTDDLAAALERRGVVVRPFTGEGIRVTIGSRSENDKFLDALEESTNERKTS